VVAWFQRYWTAIVVIIAALVVADLVISSTATCHPPPPGSTEAVKQQYNEHCSYLHGPLLISLEWLIDNIDEHDGFFVVLFTAVLAAFTAALWRSTDKLWEAGERQLKTTRSVAAVQARNTRRQLALAEDTAERQLRAYLTVKKVTTVVSQNRVAAVLEVTNNGQTPADNFSPSLHCGVTDNTNFDFPMPEIPLRSVGPIGPGDIANPRVQLKLTEEDYFTQLMDGRLKLYVFGRLDYRDCFNKDRFVNFRFEVKSQDGVWLAQPTQEGNHAN
jgi:hypothetical protein